MTIPASTRRSSVYVGNGTTTSYPFAFKVLDPATLLVVVADENDANSQTLTYQSDYTVSLNGDQDSAPGGSVEYAGLPVGHRLVILSDIDSSQPTAITNLGAFHAHVLEGSLDRIVIQVQQLQEQIDRAVKVTPTDEGDPTDLLANAITRAENAATAAEVAETAAETAQGLAETAKTGAETAKTAAETAQGLAETAKTGAETAQGLAETAKTAAETAKTSAETAKTSAETAKTGAETAQGLAELARDEAQGHATSAGTEALSAEVAAGEPADALDQFREVYLGPYASDGAANSAYPARSEGAMYWNTTASDLRVWTGSAWLVAAEPSNAYLLRDGSLPLTGPLKAVSVGSPINPAYSFDGDEDTGMYLTSANQLSFATGGALRLNITSGGTTSYEAYHAPAGSAANPAYTFTGDPNTGIYNGSADVMNFTTGGASRFGITNNDVQASVPFRAINGNGVAPAYSFISSSTTGIYGTTAFVGFTLSGTGNYGMNISAFYPMIDNARALGDAASRWSIVYAATGTINTSDAREKTPVEPMTDAEIAAAQDIARAIGTYRWLDSVEKKGEHARNHAGLTVQRAIEIMEGHGLDPMRYAFICYDRWDAELEDDVDEAGLVQGKRIVREPGDRYSFRMDQLNLFIARGLCEKQRQLEDRIAALEARL